MHALKFRKYCYISYTVDPKLAEWCEISTVVCRFVCLSSVLLGRVQINCHFIPRLQSCISTLGLSSDWLPGRPPNAEVQIWTFADQPLCWSRFWKLEGSFWIKFHFFMTKYKSTQRYNNFRSLRFYLWQRLDHWIIFWTLIWIDFCTWWQRIDPSFLVVDPLCTVLQTWEDLNLVFYVELIFT